MRRKSNTIQPPLDLQEAESVLASYAKASAKKAQIESKLEEQITKLREKKASELETLEAEIKENHKRIQLFAETQPELFEKKRSYKMSLGVIGFRTGQHKVKNKRGFTMAKCLELLKLKYPKYVNTKFTIAKDALLSDRESNDCQLALDGSGLEIVQEESFFVDLKSEKVG